jgi:RNA polymerase sigma-70 factor (ECF subfamily)
MEQADPPSPLHELTSGLARGDDAAWVRFHRDYGPGLFRQLLANACGDHDLAREALQQAYLRIARHARPCDSAPMFAGWLRVVARSALSDCRRKKQRFRELLQRRGDDPVASGAATEAEQKLHAALEAALAELAPDDRTLLEAKYFTEASVRVLAERLQVSAKAVESRLTRARAELRARLQAILSRHE